jgi:hypothetical protein
MTFAQIGPLTAGIEALATAVGAGIVLGSLAIGVARLLSGQSRQVLEAHVLTDGLIGGISGVVIACIDVAIRYGG